MQRSPGHCHKRLYLAQAILLTLCAIAVLCIVVSMPNLYAHAENIRYLYDATGHGWVCLRANEQMNIDSKAGAYPDGTQVLVLKKRDDGLYPIPRYQVQIGCIIGWVFEDELVAKDIWLQKKESGQYVPFQNHWLVNMSGQSTINLIYLGANLNDTSRVVSVNESSFIALGIYEYYVHAQFSDIDGLVSFADSISDIDTLWDSLYTFSNYEHPIWINTLRRAVEKAKGKDEANWTEEERNVFKPPVEALPPANRAIERCHDCNYDAREAKELAMHVLMDLGYIAEDNRALFESEFYILHYDYRDPDKHIWIVSYSSYDNVAVPEMGARYLVEFDAHTGEIIEILVDP